MTANPRSPLLIRAAADLREAYTAQPSLLEEQRAALARLLAQGRPGGQGRPGRPGRPGGQGRPGGPGRPGGQGRPAAAAAVRSPCVPPSAVINSLASKQPVTAWLLPEEDASRDGTNGATPSRPSTEDRLARLDRYTQNFAAKFGPLEGGQAPPQSPVVPSPKCQGTVS